MDAVHTLSSAVTSVQSHKHCAYTGPESKIMIFGQKWRNNSGPLAYNMPTLFTGCQPFHIYCIYATDCEMVCFLNLGLDFGSFLGQLCPKTMIFAKNKDIMYVMYTFSVKSWQPIKTDCIICHWSWHGVLPKFETSFLYSFWYKSTLTFILYPQNLDIRLLVIIKSNVLSMQGQVFSGAWLHERSLRKIMYNIF